MCNNWPISRKSTGITVPINTLNLTKYRLYYKLLRLSFTCIFSPSWTWLYWVKYKHSSPRMLVLGIPQLAAAYVLMQKINVSKESCVHLSVNSFLVHILLRSCLGTINQKLCFWGKGKYLINMNMTSLYFISLTKQIQSLIQKWLIKFPKLGSVTLNLSI